MLGTLLRFISEPALLRLELERAGRQGVLYALAGIVGLFAFAYLLSALNEALRLVVPAAVASLIVALCVSLLAAILVLAARRPPVRVAVRQPLVPPQPVPPLPLHVSLLEASSRTDRVTSLALAFVAGVLAMRDRR